ncbi:MAG: hypothetical protein INQ03_11375 [Candidatus Heimdallarchaeota archaeon]|nr:hypothetical protein [Candidatus Heimdallarchaeota archaeon]
MVKNISNPLNSRKIARIIVDDAEKQGLSVSESTVRLFLSDNQVNNIISGIGQLQEQSRIPLEYKISKECIDELKRNDFLDQDMEIADEADEDAEYKQSRDHDMTSQLENLVNKIFKLKSSDVQNFDRYLQRYDINFGKPMDTFTRSMKSEGIDVSETQAFTTILCADHMGLRENSRDAVYYYTFGRFDEIKDYLKSIGYEYTWSEGRGSTYIEIGKKYSVAAEFGELGQSLKSVSGIDTYTDEIIQEFFIDLLDGSLNHQLLKSNNVWRWSKENVVGDPYEWVIPKLAYGTSTSKRDLLVQTSIAHIILNAVDKQMVTLKELLESVSNLNSSERIRFLATKLEHGVTKKSIEIQFGTMVKNYFENLKDNPGKFESFIDATIRYYEKFEGIEHLQKNLEHNIRAGLKNSFGVIRKYLKEISDEEFHSKIEGIVTESISFSFKEFYSWNKESLEQFMPEEDDVLKRIDILFSLRNQNHEEIKSLRPVYFKLLVDMIYVGVKQFIKDLEPEEKEQTDGKGGLAELTQDFMGTVKLSAYNNSMIKEVLEQEKTEIFQGPTAEELVQIASYMTYQIANKEGTAGETMFLALVKYFKDKYLKLAVIPVNETHNLFQYNQDAYHNFVRADLKQATVLVSLASKTKASAYNTWTQLKAISTKNTVYLNEILVKNVIYWQRIPRELVTPLMRDKSIDRQVIMNIVNATGRINLLEAHSLIAMGYKEDINDFEEAKDFIYKSFGSTDESVYKLNPKAGEAELINEIIHLWNALNPAGEESGEVINKFAYSPINLAITLPKGFIHEYRERHWFDQIYFGKLSMSSEQQGYKPILYKFNLQSEGTYDEPLPDNILLTFFYPEKRNTQLAGIVIIGGNPDIYYAYQTSELLTPYLEAILVEKHPYSLDTHKQVISETLNLVASPTNYRSSAEIYAQTVRKTGDAVSSFYPILLQEEQQSLTLPNSFKVDALYSLEVEKEFFNTEKIGAGAKSLSLFVNRQGETLYNEIEGHLVFPLILKWMPIYADILTQMNKAHSVLPYKYEGYIKPEVIIFEQLNEQSYTALITSITEDEGKLFYNVAIARSGYSEGQPLSLLQSALLREKFGLVSWRKTMEEKQLNEEPKEYTDRITMNLIKVLDTVNLRTDEGVFDLGLVLSLRDHKQS